MDKQLWVLLSEVVSKEIELTKEESSNQEKLDFIILSMLIDYKVKKITNKSNTVTNSYLSNIDLLSDELDHALKINREQFEQITRLINN
ncbi:hypothetical protein [Paucisalibacillus globulus]|uniref:hypothetical protein n=1 Tax=Paucisalibacillus globulus TaxID=351095 RepID=UPI00040ECBF4|nr:hypothetical protein [Paucisalibacillus globulus]